MVLQHHSLSVPAVTLARLDAFLSLPLPSGRVILTVVLKWLSWYNLVQCFLRNGFSTWTPQRSTLTSCFHLCGGGAVPNSCVRNQTGDSLFVQQGRGVTRISQLNLYKHTLEREKEYIYQYQIDLTDKEKLLLGLSTTRGAQWWRSLASRQACGQWTNCC